MLNWAKIDVSKFRQNGEYFKYSVAGMVFLALLILLGVTYVFFPTLYNRGYKHSQNSIVENVSNKSPLPIATATPTPLKPDDGTKGTFTIGQGKHGGPTFRKVVLDPLDVQKGQSLTINVTFDVASTVSSLTGKLETDGLPVDITFNKISDDVLPEVWQAQINLTDTVLYKYILTLTASDSTGTSKIEVAPRS